MDSTGSVAILLTPPGAAAIAVVRLCGSKTTSFLATHFSGKLTRGRCVHGTLSDAARVIDDPIVVLSPDGLRADINLHGGPWLIRSFMDLAAREGFQVIERPGLPLPPEALEATTDIDREIESHLPLATTELALSELLRQGEAWGRFDHLPHEEQRAEAEEMLADPGLWWLLHPPRVVIAGLPNVGKSTLANQLFGQARSITADLPGTTRDWVGEMANIDGLAVMLADTPGMRETMDPIESTAIHQAAAEVRAADLVVLVVDGSVRWEPEQVELYKRFPEALVVVNKCDLPPAWDVARVFNPCFPGQKTRVTNPCHCKVIAVRGEGVDSLRGAIRHHFGVGDRATDARCWTERQREKISNLKSQI